MKPQRKKSAKETKQKQKLNSSEGEEGSKRKNKTYQNKVKEKVENESVKGLCNQNKKR